MSGVPSQTNNLQFITYNNDGSVASSTTPFNSFIVGIGTVCQMAIGNSPYQYLPTYLFTITNSLIGSQTCSITSVLTGVSGTGDTGHQSIIVSFSESILTTTFSNLTLTISPRNI